MVDVRFDALRPWALVPEAPLVNRREARHERDLYRDHFRYKRIARLPVDCPPWILGQELGWIIRSPVAVTMSPIGDVEFDVPAEEDLRSVGRKIHRTEMWRRDDAWIATTDTEWMRFYDYATPGDGWESMFVPNGSGTVEWRLGWAVRIPERYFLMVMGIGRPGLDVPVGVLAAKTLNGMAERGGISIAVGPTVRTELSRGDPVGRLVLLHPDSLRSTTTVASAASAEGS
jgi:hypothetical protein